MAEPQTETPAPAESNAAPASGGFKAWLPLLATLLLMPALAYAMTAYVLLPKLQHGLGLTAGAPAPAGEPHANADGKARPREKVTMNKLLVNVAGTMGARYLMVGLEISGHGPGFKDKMDSRDAQLRDMAMSAMRTKTLTDLEKPGAVNLLRSEFISGFNSILGEPLIQEIFITEFAIQ